VVVGFVVEAESTLHECYPPLTPTTPPPALTLVLVFMAFSFFYLLANFRPQMRLYPRKRKKPANWLTDCRRIF
jgi:hypothetical protein